MKDYLAALPLALCLLIAGGCSPEESHEHPHPSADHGAEGAVPGSNADWCGEHAVPEMEGPKVVAARLFGLRPDSLLGKAGFLNGDRVADISGVAPGAPKDRWDSIRKSDRLDVRVVRRGGLMKLTLIVE